LNQPEWRLKRVKTKSVASVAMQKVFMLFEQLTLVYCERQREWVKR